jgi:predicted acyltransferase
LSGPVEQKRLLSLDAFRGATIVGMILVNNPGSYRHIYSQLQHAEWNGWTFCDVIFPFFLFIVGVSMVFSFARRMEKGDSGARLVQQVLRRTLILFGLGLFLNSFPIFHLSTMRIPGVLQRIALCYLFASLIYLRTGIKAQIGWNLGLLSAYWLAMQFIPVPDLGAGSYLPGQNFAAYIDSLVLTGHMWARTETWDPEGIVSTLPAVSTVLFGVLAGHWLRSGASGGKKAAGMIGAGIVLALLGEVLNFWIPINKSIWTSSFAIFMAGLALVSLAVFYWVIDVKGCQLCAKFFVIFGTNAIAAYFVSEVIDRALVFIKLGGTAGHDVSLRIYLYHALFRPLASPQAASLLYAICFVLAMYLMVWIMWKKRWFLKV